MFTEGEGKKKKEQRDLEERQLVIDLSLTTLITQKIVRSGNQEELMRAQDSLLLGELISIWESYYLGGPEYALGYSSSRDPFGSTHANMLREEYNKKLSTTSQCQVEKVVSFNPTYNPTNFEGFDKPRIEVRFKLKETKQRLQQVLGQNL